MPCPNGSTAPSGLIFPGSLSRILKVRFILSGEKSDPDISAAELDVIKTLWDRGALAARDVFAALPKDHGWAIKTVKTLLERILQKKRPERKSR